MTLVCCLRQQNSKQDQARVHSLNGRRFSEADAQDGEVYHSEPLSLSFSLC